MQKQRLLPQTTIDTYGGDKFKSPDLHSVSLCDLPSGATVEYCVTSFASMILVPPLPGDDATPTVLGLVGDVGDTAQDDLNALDKYQALRPHAILVAGDWPYADGKRAKWGKWFELQEATFATISVTGIDGNHKVLTADENYKAYLRRVPGPLSDASKKALRPHYSLAIGLVHAVFLDDYTAKFGADNWRHERDQQLTWLQEDLMAVNRSTTPYVLVIKYNPFYNSFRGHQCVCGATPLEIDNVASCWVSDYNTYQEGALLRSPSQARRSRQCHRGRRSPHLMYTPHRHARKLQVLRFDNHDPQTPRDSYMLWPRTS